MTTNEITEVVDSSEIFMLRVETDGRNFEIMICPTDEVLVDEHSKQARKGAFQNEKK